MIEVQRFNWNGTKILLFQMSGDSLDPSSDHEDPNPVLATHFRHPGLPGVPHPIAGRWTALFLKGEDSETPSTCIYLFDRTLNVIRRITSPRQVLNLIRLPWDRFVIPTWGVAFASGMVGLLHTHAIVAYAPGIAIAAFLHCLLELRRERVARELEGAFARWRGTTAGEDAVETDDSAMPRTWFPSAASA